MRRTGFTLLEAAVSLAIVGTVAVGALEAFAAESRAALRARHSAPAVALAGEQLARLEMLDARALRTLPDSLRHGRAGSATQLYAWTAFVERVRNEPDLYTLRVEVRWDTGEYTLATRAYRPSAESVQ